MSGFRDDHDRRRGGRGHAVSQPAIEAALPQMGHDQAGTPGARKAEQSFLVASLARNGRDPGMAGDASSGGSDAVVRASAAANLG